MHNKKICLPKNTLFHKPGISAGHLDITLATKFSLPLKAAPSFYFVPLTSPMFKIFKRNKIDLSRLKKIHTIKIQNKKGVSWKPKNKRVEKDPQKFPHCYNSPSDKYSGLSHLVAAVKKKKKIGGGKLTTSPPTKKKNKKKENQTSLVAVQYLVVALAIKKWLTEEKIFKQL